MLFFVFIPVCIAYEFPHLPELKFLLCYLGDSKSRPHRSFDFCGLKTSRPTSEKLNFLLLPACHDDNGINSNESQSVAN